MSTQFIYNKAHFEQSFMSFLECVPIGTIKSMLDDMGASGACKKRALQIFRRWMWMRHEEWWEMDKAKELTMLWNVARPFIADVYEPQTVAEYAYDRLADAEGDLEKGIINEQRYIERCNTIKNQKEEDEGLLNANTQKTISSMNVDDETDVCLTIVCLPHDFNATATVLTNAYDV